MLMIPRKLTDPFLVNLTSPQKERGIEGMLTN